MNEHEKKVAEVMRRKGWTVLTKGWPDFMCVNWNEEEIARVAHNPRQRVGAMMREKPLHAFCIELKRGADKVRPEQAAMHTILNAAGIHCRVAWERDIEDLMNKKKPFVFSTPQQRSLLQKRVNDVEVELHHKLEEVRKLAEHISAATVLFDGEPPEFYFRRPEDEGLSPAAIGDSRPLPEHILSNVLEGIV